MRSARPGRRADETLLALAVAFGLGAEPASALAELDSRQRLLPLGVGPAHLVHAEDARPHLVLRLLAPTRELVWTCRLEDGSEQSGRLEADSGPGGSLVLPLPAGLPLGYHRLALEAGAVSTELTSIVAPPRCHLPAALGAMAAAGG